MKILTFRENIWNLRREKYANLKKKHAFLAALVIFMIILAGCNPIIYQTRKNQGADYVSCAAGLLSNKQGGSNFVVYDTKTWNPTVLLKLPDVSPDNYGAISSDGNYIAYTRWDKNIARRYLVLYSVSDRKSKAFFQDLPAKNEIINLSWLPDNQTLLFIRNDVNIPSYQEIQTLNVETGKEKILVKGEVWKIRSIEATGTTAENFYLKGHESYLKVKEKKPSESYNPKRSINPNEEWNYYLNQNDINTVFRYYGGIGTFAINNVLDLMNVEFSPPRCSRDGTKIIYSATLSRNAAPGIGTPLWMCSAIWEYDIKTGKASIVHRQTDAAAIGRVDWVDNNEISYITYYDFQGSRDSVNYLNLSTNEHRIIFPYSNKNYNNVTLLPVGNRRITFTTSKKDDIYENSSTILFDIGSNKYSKIDVKLNNNKVLLKNFVFTKLLRENIRKLGQGN